MMVDDLKIPYADVELRIEEAIREYMDQHRVYRSVIGISGGLDSSVVAYLTSRAVGSDRVVGVTMNDSVTPLADAEDQNKLLKILSIRHLNVDIESVVAQLTSELKQAMFGRFDREEMAVDEARSRLAYANIKPRMRMTALYFLANRLNGVVMGTSDRSEILMGYFTKYGDGASDFMPIADLYKTQVRELGRHLGVPNSILEKKSSPGLLSGVSAEGELGFSYDMADKVLHHSLDMGWTIEEISEKLEIDRTLIGNILERVRLTSHKRDPPPSVEVR